MDWMDCMHAKTAILITLAIVFLLPSHSLVAQRTASADKPPEPPKQANPMDPLAWLVGGVWTADAAKLAPGMLRIETQYVWSDNHRFLRFTTHFVSTQGTLRNYDGNMYWDPARKALRMWYLSASGEMTESLIALDGDRWQMDFAGTNFEDKPAQLRVIVDRKSSDLYHWSLSEKAGDLWKPLLGLDYARK
jgi:hypothetical protein